MIKKCFYDNSILFIDENTMTLDALKCLFKPYYNCYFASTKESAFTLFNDKQPAMVVCDIRLPDISGFELCRKIKQINQAFCFIFLSEQNDKITRIKGLECLADTFIDKSLDNDEIFLRIRNLHPYKHNANNASQERKSLKIRLYKAFSKHYSTTNPTNNINIGVAAKGLALSVRSLQRKLKQETELNFSQHHRAFRLEKSKQLLQQGYSSKRISKTLRFSSSAYFSCCFKKQFKITPSQYKKNFFLL